MRRGDRCPVSGARFRAHGRSRGRLPARRSGRAARLPRSGAPPAGSQPVRSRNRATSAPESGYRLRAAHQRRKRSLGACGIERPLASNRRTEAPFGPSMLTFPIYMAIRTDHYPWTLRTDELEILPLFTSREQAEALAHDADTADLVVIEIHSAREFFPQLQ